ncbi:PTS glucose transporter subunit IIB [[Mycoplasma] anseris]|uniref:PTS glucose transporter subunit IIB n=1 Tax=[Mycoplasma] anseris TaxID=92400 RepID=A0A2Z4ND45_9BACT|nr:PTS glucose transporter subunit IIB [[Mycoplasma] anseris]AWX69493.1 PTS glucose transporter subunit IIB [[Mycoplasma] anseris]
MTKKQKALYVFLIIITLGFICIYWKRKFKQTESKNYLTVETKLSFEFQAFLNSLGGKQNINNVSSSQKIIKVFFNNRQDINIENLKNLDGVSGIAFQKNSISLVVGNTAKYLEELVLKEIK